MIIKWNKRYSQNSKNDKYGRWMREGFSGIFDNLGINDNKKSIWKIACIKKLTVEKITKFTVIYFFPSNGNIVFSELKKAKEEIENSFKWFIDCCSNCKK